MAVDTANKRYSFIEIDLPFVRMFAVPDGTIDLADRQQFLMKYSGISFSGGAAVFTPRLPLLGVG